MFQRIAKKAVQFKECEYVKYMEYVKASFHDFQVCNHNYYLADAVKRSKGRHTLIPEHSIEIIDEAHKLMDDGCSNANFWKKIFW